MARNARKLLTTTGVLINRVGKLQSIIPATTGTGSAILYNGTTASDPEIYRFTAGTGVHKDLNLSFTKLYCAVTGTLSVNILYE
tara:strand:- start:248 stop:499 length:252 start_codon:yes stop_codon:yes gene_type:complete